MKNFSLSLRLWIGLVLAAALTFVVAPLAAFAQADPGVPVDLGATVFGTFGLLALAVLPLTGWLVTALKLKGATQLLSWAVAVALAYAGYGLKLGLFADAGPLTTAIYGLAAGLVANGLADTSLVQGILQAIGARVPKSS